VRAIGISSRAAGVQAHRHGAAEFASPTAYMYSTYETPLQASLRAKHGPPTRKDRHSRCARTASAGIDSIIAVCILSRCRRRLRNHHDNCNPRRWSTDYDTSDRLYFEPLTAKTAARS